MTRHNTLLINGRFRRQAVSGIQRVARAYLAHIRTPHAIIEPKMPLSGVAGHFWEQSVLPWGARANPLWSPCNVGPIFHPRHVVTVHDASTFDHPEWFSASFSRAYRAIVPRVAKRCLKLVTVSNFSRQRLIHHLDISPSRIDVIWNGVDDVFAPASTEHIASAKAKAGIVSPRYVITLSTLEPRKNLKLVLESWSRARSKLPEEYELVIVGQKGDPAIYRRAEVGGAAVPDIIFTGYVPEADLPALISGADALIYPSLYEGFGLPVIEAMACGTTAITAATSSLPEIADDAAIYVDPSDPCDLARALERVAESAACRNDYANRGLERAKSFSWKRAASTMDALLGDVFAHG